MSPAWYSAPIAAEHVADEARPLPQRAAVAVRVVHRHAVERRNHAALDTAEVEHVARLHGDDALGADDVLDERGDRAREDHPGGRRALEREAEDGRVEVVEVLVRHENPVDALGHDCPRWRRREPELVRARPRIDDAADAVDLDPEAGLPEPRQPHRRLGSPVKQYYDIDTAGPLHGPPSRVASAPPSGAEGGSSSLADQRSRASSGSRGTGPLTPILARDELGQLLRRGLGREPVERDPAVLQQVDAVAHLEHVHVVVGDDDHRVPLGLEVADQVEDHLALLRPHRRERLVEEEDPGAGVHGPRNGDRLALAAGEHGDLRAHGAQGANPDVLDVAAGALPHLTVRQPAERADPARQLAVQEHVVRDGQRRDQREILVDGVDPERACVVDRPEGRLLAVDEDPARVGPVEPAQDLDERRLAGAVVADQAEALALAE